MLPIAEKIRSLRQKRNITQTELAEALGISFQSVSRWERGMAYPDIEMIPKIAAYFGVTTDELLVANDDTKERELEELYIDYFDRYYLEDDAKKKFELSMEVYSKFPKEHKRACFIASDICKTLVENNALPRDEALPIVRELCTILLNQKTDSVFHNWALRYIYRYEDEDKLADWQKYVGKRMTEPDLLELRYLYRGEYDRHNMQAQTNLFKTINECFPIHTNKHFEDNTETARSIIEGTEISLRLFDLLRDPTEDADLFLRHRAWTYLYLSKGHFQLGNCEKGYEALEKAVDLCEILLTLPPDTILRCPNPLFDLLEVNPFERHGMYLSVADNVYTTFHSALTGNEGQWKWLEPHREEPRYLSVVKRLEKLNPIKYGDFISEDEMKETIRKKLAEGGKLIPQDKKGAE